MFFSVFGVFVLFDVSVLFGVFGLFNIFWVFWLFGIFGGLWWFWNKKLVLLQVIAQSAVVYSYCEAKTSSMSQMLRLKMGAQSCIRFPNHCCKSSKDVS